MLSHHAAAPEKKPVSRNGKHLTIALAGNANVGKSVIFNQLTGSHQTIGNWPGKTVESAKGFLDFEGYNITIVDLPGIYSLSTFSIEEIVTRDFIAREKPDVIINVIGAPVLERNLFFTLQLMEMDMPMVVCLNQIDLAESKGIKIDAAGLENRLGIPVVPTVASRGQGIRELVARAIETAKSPENTIATRPVAGEVIKDRPVPEAGRRGRHGRRRRHRRGARFRGGIDTGLTALAGLIDSENLDLDYPSHWVALKLLEGDATITDLVRAKSEKVIAASEVLARQTEEVYKQPRFAAVASERYALANEIAGDVQIQAVSKPTFVERLERLTTQRVFGYVTSVIVIAGLLLWTFTVGNALSTLLSDALSFFQPVDPQISGSFWSILWNGIFGGFVAGVTLVLPFVIPFYLLLAIMEDSGILTRVAFMLDSAMHQMGLHGKAIIPLILGFGCSVPAIAATRIMGTRRERLLASFAVTFAPCTARTIVVLGLVAVYVNIWWALALYVIDLIVMFIAVKVAVKVIPGDTPGLIMEMHSFKLPSLSVVLKQTWARTRSLIFLVFPLYMIGSAAVQTLYVYGILQPVSDFISPLTVSWLGLPGIAGILLIFGFVRKEMILLTMTVLFGANLAAVLTPVQLIVLALVGMLYIPCLSTVGILVKEFGWKSALAISAANLATAILIGGIAAKILPYIV
ncbi:MAG: ferrous iron transport protein B [Chloroflexi bacterium RBG_13_51_18]|nr:MAG: ferrous iron transport protein B [Chloroflexi bacterium RBG_13_51_18]